MPGYRVDLDGRPLELWYSNWTTRERVTFDGRVLSEKRSFAYPVSRHAVALPQDAGGGELDVRLAGPMGYIVRRDGAVVAERDRPVVRYFVSLGLIYLLLAAMYGLLNLVLLLGGAEPWTGTDGGDAAFLATLLGAYLLSVWTKREIRGDNTKSRNAAAAAT